MDFKFADVTNLKSPGVEAHARRLDTVRRSGPPPHEWTSYKEGKVKEVAKFDFTRKKS